MKVSYMTTQQIDPRKVAVLVAVIAGGGYLLRGKLPQPDTAGRPIPIPASDDRRAVQPLADVAASNSKAAKVLSAYLADFAWLVQHGTQQQYTTGELEAQLDAGARHLLALKQEVGASSFAPAINSALNALWGSTSKRISKAEAATSIYALAWALT